MTFFMCVTCGTQFAETSEAPQSCPICEDERQYVPENGQLWTTFETVSQRHKLIWSKEAEGVHSLQMTPSFAIGQRAFFIEHPSGNILWDCLSLVDRESTERIKGAGGLSAIAISHPHFYSSMVEWSNAFGNVPIYVHADDSEWILRPGPVVKPWTGEALSLGDATMVRCGGHFTGSSILHCPWLEEGRGAIFTSDTLQVTLDRKYVTFMRSYPNALPLNASTVRVITAAAAARPFETIYGGFAGRTIRANGLAALKRSMERYLTAIG